MSPEKFNYGGKIHLESGQHCPMNRGPGNERKVESKLSTDIPLLPHTFPAVMGSTIKLKAFPPLGCFHQIFVITMEKVTDRGNS